ncbi:hypothetical protein [Actinoplanes sp. CA-252034]|uniref:hypothetical protein n=1 Tax=Actinoplanes sp. CA-252034 TaxID=3239906 RepID=UPI003D994949
MAGAAAQRADAGEVLRIEEVDADVGGPLHRMERANHLEIAAVAHSARLAREECASLPSGEQSSGRRFSPATTAHLTRRRTTGPSRPAIAAGDGDLARRLTRGSHRATDLAEHAFAIADDLRVQAEQLVRTAGDLSASRPAVTASRGGSISGAGVITAGRPQRLEWWMGADPARHAPTWTSTPASDAFVADVADVERALRPALRAVGSAGRHAWAGGRRHQRPPSRRLADPGRADPGRPARADPLGTARRSHPHTLPLTVLTWAS